MLTHFIAGKWVSSGKTFPVTDPATGEVIDQVAEGSATEVERAVQAASDVIAQRVWTEDGLRRGRVLLRWADRLETNAARIAEILTRENGKLLSESRVEVSATIDALRFAAGQARMLEGRSLTPAPGLYSAIVPEPLGVVGFIVPWNWPLLIMMRELAPALAAGNAAVIKPASYAPIALTEVVRCVAGDAELLPGTINIVLGPGGSVGEMLVTHSGVNAISFTGSTQMGQRVMERASRTPKKILLELGGKSPNIIFPDAPLDKAIPILVHAMFGTAGQNCMAATRILAHRDVFSQVKERLREATRQLKVGSGLDPQSKMGPVISAQQLETISNAVQTGLRDGGKLVIGGERLDTGALRKGNFFAPTIVEHVPLSSRMVQQEIFGPVASLEEFSSNEEAIELANGTAYGLVAGVWTRDLTRATRVAREIKAGTIWINTYMRTFAEAESGGMKTSGLGRSRGRVGLYEYTELKHILSDTNG